MAAVASVAAVALAAGAMMLARWVTEAREEGKRTQCANQLRQCALSLISYQFAKGEFPPATFRGETLPPERRLSWVVLILPWTDYFQGLQIFFAPDRPWDSRENLWPRGISCPVGGPETEIASMELPGLGMGRCPARADAASRPRSWISYVGIAGVGTDAATLPRTDRRAGVFGYDRSAHTGDITDGVSETLLLAETTLDNGPWTAGGPATVRGLDPGRQPYVGQGRQFGGLHRGGVNAVFADGSVRFLSESIDPKVFEALSTVAGGEDLPTGWDR